MFFTIRLPNPFRGEAVFNFGAKIGLKGTKNVLFCILFRPMRGFEPPAPPLATLLLRPIKSSNYLINFFFTLQLRNSPSRVLPSRDDVQELRRPHGFHFSAFRHPVLPVVKGVPQRLRHNPLAVHFYPKHCNSNLFQLYIEMVQYRFIGGLGTF